jgi:predicted AAA+ superfamily ATPase
MYLVFVVRPFTKNINRAIQKPPKVYFFDNADVVGDDAAVFENFVACHLLKKIHFLEDCYGDSYEICYIRDKSKREVDFAILKNGKLEELIEVKWRDEKTSTALKYYSEKLHPSKSQQIIYNLDHSYQIGKLHVTSAREALGGENIFV